MSPFYSLDAITDANPWQMGETAYLMHQLSQLGHSVPNSWVIPAEYFQRSLSTLTVREPLYEDWPKLLWQTSSTTGYPVQHLAKRLQRPLLNFPLQLPWTELLTEVKTPVVRLLPSLWFGDNVPTAPWGQMLAAPLCLTEPDALETALKQVFTSALNAKSLAFWSRWPKAGRRGQPYPVKISVAVVIQAVEPALLSGFFTLRSGHIEIEAVQGLPEAIAESYPDIYQGHLPNTPHFTWEPGYQEQRYLPSQPQFLEDTPMQGYTRESVTQRTLEVINNEIEQQLWLAIKELDARSTRPFRVGWHLSEKANSVQFFHACWWPMQSLPSSTTRAPSVPNRGILGHAASPGKRCGLALVLSPDMPLPESADQQIVIASEVFPAWLPLLKTAIGVISEQGGLTCHAAVLARELGIPAIVGVTDATHHFKTGDVLQIDGDRGLIEPLSTLPSATITSKSLSEISTNTHQTNLWLNLSQPDDVVTLAQLPIAGVGLLRSEWLMMPVLEHQHPYRWLAAGYKDELKTRLIEQLRPILQAFSPRPVRYRTLDIRSNEFAQLLGAPAVESNPMLGIRGTFSYWQHPDFFEFELDVLKDLREEGWDNVHLVLPFVRTVQEILYCKKRVQDIGLDQTPNFELWIMAEVPSVLFSLEQYIAAGIQGIAIGTHDLTQLILGIDRDQRLFSSHFDETHPAVQAAIAQIIHQARRWQIPCCLCGVSPVHHPDFVETMIREGITDISVDAAVLEVTSALIQQAESNH